MLIGVEIATTGCRQITASYGDGILSCVVSIADDQRAA